MYGAQLGYIHRRKYILKCWGYSGKFEWICMRIVFRYHHVRHCAIPVLWRILRQAAAVMMVQRRSESGVGVYVVLSTHAFASPSWLLWVLFFPTQAYMCGFSTFTTTFASAVVYTFFRRIRLFYTLQFCGSYAEQHLVFLADWFMNLLVKEMTGILSFKDVKNQACMRLLASHAVVLFPSWWAFCCCSLLMWQSNYGFKHASTPLQNGFSYSAYL